MGDWIWIVPLIYFLFSAIGGVVTNKAKEAAEKSRDRRQRTTIQSVGEEVSSVQEMMRASESTTSLPATSRPATSLPARPQASPKQKTADQIAAEIRRMMGLPPEPAAQPVEVIEDHYEEAEEYTEASQQTSMVPEEQRSHGGSLRERLAAREAGGRHSVGSLADRHLVSSLAGRRLGISAPLRRSSERRVYLDVKQLAKAFITAEILGKPKALRPDEW